MQTIQDGDVNKDTQSTENAAADNETENTNGTTSDTDTAVGNPTDELQSYEGTLAVDHLNKLSYFLADIFVGRVIDVKQLNDSKDTPNVFLERIQTTRFIQLSSKKRYGLFV